MASPLDRTTLHTWLHHWQDEADAAYLYLVLAGQEPDQKRKDVYIKLAGVEERHVQMWEQLLGEHGVRVGRPRPSLNARLRAWVGAASDPATCCRCCCARRGRRSRDTWTSTRRPASRMPG